MKRLLLIVLPLFISVGFSQQITHTETYESGNIKSITYHKKIGVRIEKVKEEEYFENGRQRFLGRYKNGRREHGLWTKWYANGQKREETNYIDGKKDGLHTAWYANGQKDVEITYKDDKPVLDGLIIKWYENGQKHIERIYKDGEVISSKEWNKDGSVKE
tara:strand:- start:131 stop:610 length:480 start_codon:yes stop_codon:yes gene_type:complete